MRDSDPDKWACPPHTRAKHDIFARYLDAWYPILASGHSRVLVMDGFAGRGRYTSGEPGSPVIALDRLLNHGHWPRMRHREFVFLFIEHDPDNVTSLRQVLAEYAADYEQDDGAWPPNVKIQVLEATFEQHAQEIVGYLAEQKSRIAPTFAFIDPFGWKGLPMQTIADLLNHPSCEVFVNFMVEKINRFIEHPLQGGNMSELFDLDVDQVLVDYQGGDRVAHLRDVYVRQLEERANFDHVRWFAMWGPTNRIIYYLIHGTREHRGVEKMKDAMWATDPTGDYSFSDKLAGLDVLFQPEPDLGPLRATLVETYAGGSNIMVNPDLQRWVILHTPYRKPHLTAVLRELEADGVITVGRPPTKRQFSPGVTISVPQAVTGI